MSTDSMSKSASVFPGIMIRQLMTNLIETKPMYV